MGEGIDAVDSAYDIKTLKEFVNTIGDGIDGGYSDPKPSKRSVKQVWKRFLAAFKRKHGQIPASAYPTIVRWKPHRVLEEDNLDDLDDIDSLLQSPPPPDNPPPVSHRRTISEVRPQASILQFNTI